MNDEKYMHLAIDAAKKCACVDEVPVGAVIVRRGEVIAEGFNRCMELCDPTMHAETVAITNACRALGSRFLNGCIMYVTLEPCPMCSGAIMLSRLDKVVFGAYEDKFGAVGSKFNLFYDYKFNHDVRFRGGVLEDECRMLLQDFFKAKRRNQI